MSLLRDPLLRAWLALVALSGLATLLSLRSGRVFGVAILLIALVKAWLILSRYLGLAQVRPWLNAFSGLCLLLGTLLLALYLAA